MKTLEVGAPGSSRGSHSCPVRGLLQTTTRASGISMHTLHGETRIAKCVVAASGQNRETLRDGLGVRGVNGVVLGILRGMPKRPPRLVLQRRRARSAMPSECSTIPAVLVSCCCGNVDRGDTNIRIVPFSSVFSNWLRDRFHLLLRYCTVFT